MKFVIFWTVGGGNFHAHFIDGTFKRKLCNLSFPGLLKNSAVDLQWLLYFFFKIKLLAFIFVWTSNRTYRPIINALCQNNRFSATFPLIQVSWIDTNQMWTKQPTRRITIWFDYFIDAITWAKVENCDFGRKYPNFALSTGGPKITEILRRHCNK